ncbi:MAG: autotransporter outer membrane beta-barrel domain-containing protein [Elusimicrobia bacterium]|nr:autotransporter outer membrane beta-barrel domain-containing protein [Elusimicrobiota bacterium]
MIKKLSVLLCAFSALAVNSGAAFALTLAAGDVKTYLFTGTGLTTNYVYDDIKAAAGATVNFTDNISRTGVNVTQEYMGIFDGAGANVNVSGVWEFGQNYNPKAIKIGTLTISPNTTGNNSSLTLDDSATIKNLIYGGNSAVTVSTSWYQQYTTLTSAVDFGSNSGATLTLNKGTVFKGSATGDGTVIFNANSVPAGYVATFSTDADISSNIQLSKQASVTFKKELKGNTKFTGANAELYITKGASAQTIDFNSNSDIVVIKGGNVSSSFINGTASGILDIEGKTTITSPALDVQSIIFNKGSNAVLNGDPSSPTSSDAFIILSSGGKAAFNNFNLTGSSGIIFSTKGGTLSLNNTDVAGNIIAADAVTANAGTVNISGSTNVSGDVNAKAINVAATKIVKGVPQNPVTAYFGWDINWLYKDTDKFVGKFNLGAESFAIVEGNFYKTNVTLGKNSQLWLGGSVDGNISGASGDLVFVSDTAAQTFVSGNVAARSIVLGYLGDADVLFQKDVKGNIIFDNDSGTSAAATVNGNLNGSVYFGTSTATFNAGKTVNGQVFYDTTAAPGDLGVSTVNVSAQTNAKGAAVDTVFNKDVLVTAVNVGDNASALFKSNVGADINLNGQNSKLTLSKILYGDVNAAGSGAQIIMNAKSTIAGDINGGAVVTKGVATVLGDINADTLTLGKGKFTFGGSSLAIGADALTLGSGQTFFLSGNMNNLASFNFADLSVLKGGLLDLNTTKVTLNGNLTVDKGATVNSVLVDQNMYGGLVADNIFSTGLGAAALKVAVAANFDETTNGTFEIIKGNTSLDSGAFAVSLAKNRLFNLTLDTGCGANSICVDVTQANGLPLSGLVAAGAPAASAVMDKSAFAASFTNPVSTAMRGAFTKAVESGTSNAMVNNLFALAQFDDTLGDFNKALNAWAPDARGVAYYAQANRKEIQNSTYSRTQGEDVSADAADRQAVWVTGFYNETDQSSRGNGFGFNGYTGGAEVGVDKYFTDKLLLGLAYAYTDASLVSGGKTTVTGNTGVLYGAYDFTPEFFVNVMGSYTDSDYKNYGVTAKYGGYQLSADAQAGYRIDNGDFEFTPVAGAGYNRAHVDGYTDSASQEVLAASSGAWQLEAGLKAGYNVKNTGSVSVKPRVSLLASYDLNDGSLIRGAVLPGGGLYFVADNNAAPWGLDGGLGVDFTLRKSGLKLSADVRGIYKDGYTSTTYSASARLPF